jgi:uncharacterized ferritin-like protein (DUF455 family)
MGLDQESLFDRAAACLAADTPAGKVALCRAAAEDVARGVLHRRDSEAVAPIGAPGRPARPNLVEPRRLPQRGLGTPSGRAALVHAVAHIEFNAIDLAWDAVYRFRDMPEAFYADWAAVAADEARHFCLLQERLAELGHVYGDFDAHNGLWEMAVRTSRSCLERMALVPRVLEARGLDVTPGMIARLREVGDDRTAGILEIILAEEVAHVAAGTRWFAWCCEREGREPEATFAALIAAVSGTIRAPFNEPARRRAGFSAGELAHLRAVSAC